MKLGDIMKAKKRSVDFRVLSLRVASLLTVVLLVTACNRGASLTLAQPRVANSSTSVGVRTSYADVVARDAPAVITIRTEKRVRAPQQFPFMNDPFFRQFFGNQLPQMP